MRLQKIASGKQLRGSFNPQLLILCLFFLMGVAAGLLAQRLVSIESHTELREYLQRYAAALSRDSLTPVSFFRVLAVYFRYPVMAFCLGFCSLGIFLLPVLCAVQGFFLSFSVGCFVAAMGRYGAYLAFCAFGLRVLFTLPCLMLIAMQVLCREKRHASVLTRREKNVVRCPGRSDFILFGSCAIVLLLGTLLEITLIPHLFEWLLHKMM